VTAAVAQSHRLFNPAPPDAALNGNWYLFYDLTWWAPNGRPRLKPQILWFDEP
jgi:hypothetical protein